MAEEREGLKEGDSAVNMVVEGTEPVQNGLVDDEPNFSDPEGFVDDITDEELVGDLLRVRPKESDGVDTVIVVDGVPKVGPERWEKLRNVIRRVFSAYGEIVNENFPTDNEITKGYLFLEYSSPANALQAVRGANNFRLDKNYTFTVNLLSDFDKFVNVPDKWEPPEHEPYKDPGNLQAWLLDPDCYDQYSVIYCGGDRTSICLNSMQEPVIVADRSRWTEKFVRWSPFGTYLATFHHRGIALWGGENFHQILRLSHQDVQFFDFSPCENYLVTFSPQPDSKDDPQCTIIWDLRSGAKKRAFPTDPHPIWPIFKWSYDDKYFARLNQEKEQEGISIYETPSFGLWEKKSLKIRGLKDFSWSPTSGVLSYWVAEDDNVPARVCVMEFPSRSELRTKNLFNVADCKMHWQKSGDYLCVKVDRYSKIRREKTDSGELSEKYVGLYYNLEIFHMKEKQIPVDSVEIKEPIIAFAWEPVGGKFCLIHGDNPNTSVSIYSVKAGGGVSLINKFERMQCNHIFWSPHGQFVLIANLCSVNGTLNFIDTADMTIMNHAEHELASAVEWDPTGRYVVTSISWWSHMSDSGFMVWSFQGKLLRQSSVDRFCELLWRPRPPTLMTPEQIKDIQKNLKKYSTQFEVKDRLALTKASKELIEKRRALITDFESYRSQKNDEYEDEKKERLRLRNGIDTDELDSHVENMEEETVEFFIKEEIIEVDEE